MSNSEQTPSNTNNAITYRDAGVDIDAGNALVDAIKPDVKSTTRPGSMGAIGGFGGLFDLKAAGYDDPILVAANDGVGTKLKIAIETGEHKSIGIDLVAMCVNDLVVQGAEPLFFLDYYATGKLDVTTAKAVIAGIANGCRQAGCALIGGETAEMPGMYNSDDYDLAGFSVGAAERNALLPQTNIGDGDVIIGMRSSGIHSNGYSLIRRLVEKANLNWDDEAPWQVGTSVARALLVPTRIYVKPLLAVMAKKAKGLQRIKALAHITGGGLTENLPRVLPPATTAQINLAAWTPNPVFKWAAQTGNISEHEMLRTLNCGIGMIAITNANDAPSVMSELSQLCEDPVHIGTIHTSGDHESAPIVEYANTLELTK